MNHRNLRASNNLNTDWYKMLKIKVFEKICISSVPIQHAKPKPDTYSAYFM